MSESADGRAATFRAGEARRLGADADQGRVLSEPARTLVLSYPVKDFPWLRTWEGSPFEPDTIELTFEWWDGWLLSEVEVSGSDRRFLPSEEISIVARDVNSKLLPPWVRDFVASVDPAKLLAAS